MKKNNDNYFENRNEKNILKTREILNDIPDFAKEFFVGIQMRTSELTRLNYAYDMRIFFDYLSKIKLKCKLLPTEITLAQLNELSALDIELYMEHLSNYKFNGKTYKCGENAKERKLSSLRSFFSYYYKKDKLRENVSSKVDLPKLHDKTIVRLEKNEIYDLLNEAETADNFSKMQKAFHKSTQKRDSALLTLFLGTGIRISECIGIDKDDIDFKNNSFIITRKGGNKSILYFSNEVASALVAYIDWLNNEVDSHTSFGNKIKDSNALFFSIQGKRICVRSVELLVKKYSAIITPLKKITPHKLRSTYGTELYRETQDIYVVADVLGHKDINTTKKHYAAMSDEIRKKASNAVKLHETVSANNILKNKATDLVDSEDKNK